MKRHALTLLLSGLIAQVHASDLPGRLFYTPTQRAQLEAARSHGTPASPDSAKPTAQDATYNGYILRGDGSVTVWVNGQPRRLPHARSAPDTLRLPATPALKPGQQYSSRHGRVLESFERPAPPAPAMRAATPRKTQRSSLLDGDDAPTDPARDGDATQPPATGQ